MTPKLLENSYSKITSKIFRHSYSKIKINKKFIFCKILENSYKENTPKILESLFLKNIYKFILKNYS